jgi:hypothetical protein
LPGATRAPRMMHSVVALIVFGMAVGAVLVFLFSVGFSV